MLRFCILLGLAAVCVGCATEGHKNPFDDALKDLRGDNMQMRSNFSGLTASDYSQKKSRD